MATTIRPTEAPKRWRSFYVYDARRFCAVAGTPVVQADGRVFDRNGMDAALKLGRILKLDSRVTVRAR